jgi:hypothetical protein
MHNKWHKGKQYVKLNNFMVSPKNITVPHEHCISTKLYNDNANKMVNCMDRELPN